jgi:hypothetical protein
VWFQQQDPLPGAKSKKDEEVYIKSITLDFQSVKSGFEKNIPVRDDFINIRLREDFKLAF